jgi:branched-chain amino acid aminotransferase
VAGAGATGGAWAWIDGSVVPAEQARIAAIDHGLTIGHGVFETCKIANGVVFALGRHLRRLARSAAILRLDCPAPDRLRVAVDELLAATTPLPLGRLRITVTAGTGLLTLGGGTAPPTVVMIAAPRRRGRTGHRRAALRRERPPTS